MSSLKDDILAPVRQKLLDEGQQLLVKTPQDVEANLIKQGGNAGMGASADTAATKLGLVAAVPAAIIAGIIGYLGGPKGTQQ